MTSGVGTVEPASTAWSTATFTVVGTGGNAARLPFDRDHPGVRPMRLGFASAAPHAKSGKIR